MQQDRHHMSSGVAMLPYSCCYEPDFESFQASSELFLMLQCRQKTVEDKPQCTTCNQQWCPKCLTNRYGPQQEQVCTTILLHSTPPSPEIVCFAAVIDTRVVAQNCPCDTPLTA